jgi:hypothetical protein
MNEEGRMNTHHNCPGCGVPKAIKSACAACQRIAEERANAPRRRQIVLEVAKGLFFAGHQNGNDPTQTPLCNGSTQLYSQTILVKAQIFADEYLIWEANSK